MNLEHELDPYTSIRLICDELENRLILLLLFSILLLLVWVQGLGIV